jgi:hypothetical protein
MVFYFLFSGSAHLLYPMLEHFGANAWSSSTLLEQCMNLSSCAQAPRLTLKYEAQAEVDY